MSGAGIPVHGSARSDVLKPCPPPRPTRDASRTSCGPGATASHVKPSPIISAARMLDAVSEVVSEKGYVAMTVEDVIAAAGVSRRTFYDHFKGKEPAYLEAFEVAGAELIRRVGEAYEREPLACRRSRRLPAGVPGVQRGGAALCRDVPGRGARGRPGGDRTPRRGAAHARGRAPRRRAERPSQRPDAADHRRVGDRRRLRGRLRAPDQRRRTRAARSCCPISPTRSCSPTSGADVALELTHRFTGLWPTGLDQRLIAR